jgi:hypothetical protein
VRESDGHEGRLQLKLAKFERIPLEILKELWYCFKGREELELGGVARI